MDWEVVYEGEPFFFLQLTPVVRDPGHGGLDLGAQDCVFRSLSTSAALPSYLDHCSTLTSFCGCSSCPLGPLSSIAMPGGRCSKGVVFNQKAVTELPGSEVTCWSASVSARRSVELRRERGHN